MAIKCCPCVYKTIVIDALTEVTSKNMHCHVWVTDLLVYKFFCEVINFITLQYLE